MTMTTSSSIRVKPRREGWGGAHICESTAPQRRGVKAEWAVNGELPPVVPAGRGACGCDRKTGRHRSLAGNRVAEGAETESNFSQARRGGGPERFRLAVQPLEHSVKHRSDGSLWVFHRSRKLHGPGLEGRGDNATDEHPIVCMKEETKIWLGGLTRGQRTLVLACFAGQPPDDASAE